MRNLAVSVDCYKCPIMAVLCNTDHWLVTRPSNITQPIVIDGVKSLEPRELRGHVKIYTLIVTLEKHSKYARHVR